jgi:hypothetical protein
MNKKAGFVARTSDGQQAQNKQRNTLSNISNCKTKKSGICGQT